MAGQSPMTADAQVSPLNSLSINRRLWILAGTLVSLIVILGVLSVVALDRSRQGVDAVKRAADAAEYAGLISREVADLRFDAYRFIQTGDQRYLDALKSDEETLNYELEVLDGLVTTDAARNAVETLADHVRDFEATANAVADRRGRFDGRVEVEITDHIEALDRLVGNLQVHGAEGRRLAADWARERAAILEAVRVGQPIIGETALSGLATIQEDAEALAQAVAGVQGDVSALRREVADLEDALPGVVDERAALNREAVMELESEAEAVAEESDELVTRFTEAAAEAQQTLVRQITMIEIVIGVLAAVAGLIAIIASILIARSIIRPINAVGHAMAEFAAGDLNVVVPHTRAKDEVAAMARTIEDFKSVAADAVRSRIGLDNAAVGVAMTDVSDSVGYANDALEDMVAGTSVGRRELIGQPGNLFGAAELSSLPAIRENSTPLSAVITVEGRVFQVTVSAVVDDQGRPLGRIFQWEDLTKEAQVEAEIEAVISQAVKGDFSGRLTVDDKKGFSLKVAEGINRLSATVSDVTESLAESLEALAEGNLRRRMNSDYEGVFARVADDFNGTVDQLSRLVGQIRGLAGALNQASREVASGSTDLSERTETQAANLEEAAAAMEQMVATVRSNAANAREASRLVEDLRTNAHEGGTVAQGAAAAIARIEDSAKKITDIITVIDDIAFQTNLLALNAAVEAARAGEAGRGFAVVAQEVRTLAQRSAQSSREIKGLIHASNAEVETGVEQVTGADRALQEIAGSVEETSRRMTDIAQASSEQANALDEVNSTVAQMDESTQKNAALVEESTAAAKALQDQAEELMDLLSFFQSADSPESGGPTASVAPRPSPVSKPAPPPAPRRAATTKPGSPSGSEVKSSASTTADWRSLVSKVDEDPSAIKPGGAKVSAAATSTADADWEEF